MCSFITKNNVRVVPFEKKKQAKLNYTDTLQGGTPSYKSITELKHVPSPVQPVQHTN